MNDFDDEKIERLLNSLTPYEKVLLEKERREIQKEEKERRELDRFIKDGMGEFYNYQPWED